MIADALLVAGLLLGYPAAALLAALLPTLAYFALRARRR